MTKRQKAEQALAHLAQRYRGESGYPSKDYPVLQLCVQQIVAALDDGSNNNNGAQSVPERNRGLTDAHEIAGQV